MIEGILVGFAAIILGAWIVRPLFRPPAPARQPDSVRLDQLLESKQAVLRSMLDLEFDHKVGKVSEKDLAAIRSQHEAEAIAILRELDREASVEETADLLEAEIALARVRLRRE